MKVPAILKGLGRTLKHAVGTTFSDEAITVSYPEEEKPRPLRFRGRHVLNRYENGLERCIGCSLCAAACPAEAIWVEAAENDPENRVSPGERYAVRYEINMLRCIFCGMCEEACPTGAVQLGYDYKMVDEHGEQHSWENRDNFIFTKDMLLTKPRAHRPDKLIDALDERMEKNPLKDRVW